MLKERCAAAGFKVVAIIPIQQNGDGYPIISLYLDRLVQTDVYHTSISQKIVCKCATPFKSLKTLTSKVSKYDMYHVSTTMLVVYVYEVLQQVN